MNNPFYLDGLSLIHSAIPLREDLRLYVGKQEVSFHLHCQDIVSDMPFPWDEKICIHYQGQDYSPQLRFITHSPEFAEAFHPEIEKLGTQYTPEATYFAAYAPLADAVNLCTATQTYPLAPCKQGVWRLTLAGNQEGLAYEYEIWRAGESLRAPDPFAWAVDKNERYSIVLDPHKFLSKRVILAPLKKEKACIYELSVRDFSSANIWPGKHHKTILALCERGLSIENVAVGFDHLLRLGISHIQIMPIFAFASPEEYNWGYNPLSYHLLQREYGESEDPYQRIRELRQTVDAYHRAGIRVNLDVVFNHVYQPESFIWNAYLPYAFFRFTNGTYANGSFCGNELRTEFLFCRDYLTHMCERYIDLWDIDGLRFDLMSLLDKTTMQQIYQRCQKRKKDFWIYGEGWDLPSALEKKEMTSLQNASEFPDIAFFDDIYRDSIIGKADGGIFRNIAYRESIKKGLSGKVEKPFIKNEQRINYVECHDGYTLYDRLQKEISGLEETEIEAYLRLAAALVLLAPGIAFLHAGQEFARSKQGYDNSYNACDEINQLDWQRCAKKQELVRCFQELIALRRQVGSLADGEIFDYYEVISVRKENYLFLFNVCCFEHIYPLSKPMSIVYPSALNNIATEAVAIAPFSLLVLQEITSV